MGVDEAVTPVFPNSDYWYGPGLRLGARLVAKLCSTGIAGSIAVMHALIRRAEQGGSYGVDVSL